MSGAVLMVTWFLTAQTPFASSYTVDFNNNAECLAARNELYEDARGIGAATAAKMKAAIAAHQDPGLPTKIVIATCADRLKP